MYIRLNIKIAESKVQVKQSFVEKLSSPVLPLHTAKINKRNDGQLSWTNIDDIRAEGYDNVHKTGDSYHVFIVFNDFGANKLNRGVQSDIEQLHTPPIENALTIVNSRSKPRFAIFKFKVHFKFELQLVKGRRRVLFRFSWPIFQLKNTGEYGTHVTNP